MTLAMAARPRACRRGPSAWGDELDGAFIAWARRVPCGVARIAVCILEDNA
jgi:hypothetical protein